MLGFAIGRIAQAIPLMAVVVLLVFGLLHLIPGVPVQAMVGHARDGERRGRPALNELILAEIVVGGAEACDQLSAVERAKEVRARPLAVADTLHAGRVDGSDALREK